MDNMCLSFMPIILDPTVAMEVTSHNTLPRPTLSLLKMKRMSAQGGGSCFSFINRTGVDLFVSVRPPYFARPKTRGARRIGPDRWKP
ncbi:uncharacterized protein LY89DRAFT_692088, partial [Mollisia scopiformis]